MKRKKIVCIILVLTMMLYSTSNVFAVEGDENTDPDTEVTDPTATPTEVPTEEPTEPPTEAPTEEPTKAPTEEPTAEPTKAPTAEPTGDPTKNPTDSPTAAATNTPTPLITGTPAPTVTEGPTTTPTGTPYATVVPPDITETYPKPSSKSDKSVDSKSPSVIKIDGIYDEMWDNIEAIPIKNVSWGESGASGYFKVYWDKEALYVLVDVNDSTPDTRSDRFTRQDCIEIFVNESASKPEIYGDGDLHFKVNRDGVVEYGNGANETVVDYELITKDDGYMVEASIKFTTITPAYGQAIGFDVRINDSQGHQYRDYMLQWSDTSMETYINLSKIGTLYLK